MQQDDTAVELAVLRSQTSLPRLSPLPVVRLGVAPPKEVPPTLRSQPLPAIPHVPKAEDRFPTVALTAQPAPQPASLDLPSQSTEADDDRQADYGDDGPGSMGDDDDDDDEQQPYAPGGSPPTDEDGGDDDDDDEAGTPPGAYGREEPEEAVAATTTASDADRDRPSTRPSMRAPLLGTLRAVSMWKKSLQRSLSKTSFLEFFNRHEPHDDNAPRRPKLSDARAMSEFGHVFGAVSSTTQAGATVSTVLASLSKFTRPEVEEQEQRNVQLRFSLQTNVKMALRLKRTALKRRARRLGFINIYALQQVDSDARQIAKKYDTAIEKYLARLVEIGPPLVTTENELRPWIPDDSHKDDQQPVLMLILVLLNIAATAFAIFWSGEFLPIGANPFLGPTQRTLVYCGAKSGQEIIVHHAYWRLLTAIWVHGGILHCLLVVLLQIFIGMPFERSHGVIQTGIFYACSGIVGLLSSTLFVPNTVACGGLAGMFGILGANTIEIFHNWRERDDWVRDVFKQLLVLFICFFAGFLPDIDNFSSMAGLLCGVLLSLTVLPVHFGRKRIIIIALGILGLVAVVITGFGWLFLLRSSEDCSWCRRFRCYPILDWPSKLEKY